MRISGLVRAVVVLGLGVLAGCRDGRGSAGRHPAPAGVTTSRASALTSISHTGWVASASQTQSGSPASNAIDSDEGTRWTTGDSQSTQWFKVDMGAPKAFVQVEIRSNDTDYPRQFNVQVSNNNSTWTTVASAAGTSSLVQVPFAQQQARYVRIQLATSGQQYYLSIYDFKVHSTQHSTAAWAPTSSGVTSTDTEAKAIDASLTTKWTSSTYQSPNGQWYQLDMRKRQTFSMVSLDGGATTNTTYPRGYKIEASDDLSTWSTLATGTGAAGVIFASFTTTQARYLKVTQTGTASTVKWSLYDLLVYGQPEAPSVLSQVGWIATASKLSLDASKAIDSTMSTGWGTETYQAVGDWYQVDMGSSKVVSGITMNSDTSTDYARAFNVYVGDDPMNFGAPAGSGTGTSPFVTAVFAPKTGRYVRVQLTSVPGTSDWFQFCEFNVLTPALARSGWIVKASSTGGADIVQDAFDNDSTCRWNSAESQATEHWVTVDMVTQQIFNRITLDASPSPLSVGNYPRSYEVYVSNDGTNWGTAVATGSGTGQAITINFLTQTARYLKIRQPAAAGVTNTWSIHELDVYREAQSSSCDTVTCTASDQCHDVGTCNPATGVCSNPVKANGASCNDANACTQTDTCQSGTCTGANPVVCTADQCHVPGTCSSATGVCSAPTNKSNGTSCNDANACTQTDTCQSGTCTGASPITCTASDQCHTAGTCTPATGTCSNPVKANGSTCTDGNVCTQIDTCQSGTCTGASPITCTASDQCHTAGVCDPGTGCSNPAKANGTTCSDGNVCTQTDTCQSGTCAGASPITCTASDQCHTAGVCNPVTGCSNPAKANGTTCSDGNACTQADTCQTGTCTGGNAVTCTASDQCHTPGTCAPGTGCSNPVKANGTSCNDANACTQTDTCQSGTCTGASPITCTASDQCHAPGTCNPLTGACTNPAAPNGTSCSDGDSCTVSDVCSAGLCAGSGSPTVNAGPDQRAALQSSAPPPSFTMQQITTTFNNPVGIAYHGPTNKMMMSVNCCSGEPYNLELVNPDGTRQKFGTIHGLSNEVYFAIPRNEQNGKSLGGFVAGEVLIGTGVAGDIARIAPDGLSMVNPWVHLPGETGLLRGQLTLDTTGLYGGDLIVMTTAGGLWRVTSGGQATLITTMSGGYNEGLAVIPNNPTKFGPFAGKILVGDENSVLITAVAPDGTKTTHNLGIGIENIMIVPDNENLFGVDWNGSKLWGASASQFNGKEGDLLLSEEYGGRLFRVSWNGTSFDKTLLFTVALWEHMAFGPAGMVEVAPVGVPLAGTVTDEGCPDGSVVTTNWSVLSGPGTVMFSDAHSKTSTASFSSEGTYVLRLTATNGTYTGYDDTTVVISKTGLANTTPVVNAGPDQTVRLPNVVDLAGFANDDGVPVGSSLALSWSQVSGPAPATFIDSTAGFTTALFDQPGTYVLQLRASDGDLSSTDNVTITITPEPSLVGGSLLVALGTAGPLAVGSQETLVASLTNLSGAPVSDVPLQVTVAGANPTSGTVVTDAAGVARFVYTGTQVGSDTLSAVALGSFPLSSNQVTLAWAPVATGPVATQGWIGSPAHQSTVTGLVPITLGAGVTLTSGTVTYWPMSAPGQVNTLATGVSGGPGATVATLDTTTLSNGPYVIRLNATNASGQQQDNQVAVTVNGDYKPGRVVVEVNELTIPLPGLPLPVIRRYDSLEKDSVGDFGRGWSLAVGHPKLEVDPAHNVTITMPDNRRTTFHFQASSISASAFYAWLYGPGYVAEAGTYGTLTADGCSLMVLSAGQLVCFLESSLEYVPTTYTYTDPYGRVFTMAATGELKSIKDRQQNTLTFTSGGIMSSTGVGVTFARDTLGRITKVTSPAFDVTGGTAEYTYDYDAAGDLTAVHLPASSTGAGVLRYTYDNHRLLTSKDAKDQVARTSTYDPAGRLLTDTDPLGNLTSYAYDLSARKTTITNPDLGTVEQTFDARGLLLKEIDPLGRKTEHTYDGNKNELTRKNALNEVTTFTYDPNGNQASIKNQRDEVTTTTYNAYGQPLTSENPLHETTTIEYDTKGIPTRFSDGLGTLATFTSSERGLPLSVTDVAGNTSYMVYDGAGNLTSRTDRLGRVTRNVYDGIGRLTQVTDPRGGVTSYAYLSRGQRSRMVDASGIAGHRTRNYAYDQNDNVVTETSDEGRTTSYSYDALNHLTKVTNPDLTTVEYTRDFRGNPLTMKDEAGRTTTYEYDKAGQLKKTIFPGGALTTRAYDDLGRLVTATDERNNATAYEYQAGCGCAERQTKVTDPLNRSTTTTYDAAGRRATVTDAANHTTSYTYDTRGHLTTTTYADNTSETDAYDTRGRRTSHTDQMTSVTQYGYDAEGQLTSVTDALTNLTSYGYDAAGNLTSVRDANNHVTTYAYDALNRKTRRTLPLGMYETFAYNMYGDQTSHVDFRGKTTTTIYDTRSRLLTKVPDPTLGEPAVGFTYNPTGTRATMTDGSGGTGYTYDTRDRLLTKATAAGTLTYTYDPAGNVATVRSSNTNGTSVDYAWDAANQLVSVTDNRAGGLTTSAYTATGRPSTLGQPSGVAASYGYDARDRVTSLAWRQGTSPPVSSWSYGFNNRGQRTTVTQATGRHVAYGYDAVTRLISETVTSDPTGPNGAITYSLDPTGNRLTRTSNLAPIGSATYSYDANDQLGTDGYDLNGNTTSAAGHPYGYDFESRLKSKDGSAVTIVYDGDGNRVAKTAGGVTTKYLVDDLNPTGYLQVLEEVGVGGVQVEFTYGTMLVSQRRVAAGGATSYYGYDATGNVAFLTDPSGAVTDEYDYDSSGNIVVQSGETVNTRLYAGEEFDPDLGLINLRARHYEGRSGRFMTSDPAEGVPTNPVSLNRYIYGEADPVNRQDPLGLFSRTAPRGGSLEYAGLLTIGAALVLVPMTVELGTDGRYIKNTSGIIFAVGNKVVCQMLISASGFGVKPAGIFSYCKKKDDDCDSGNGPGGSGGSGSGGGVGGGGGGDPRSLLHHCYDVCAAKGLRRAALMKGFLERLRRMCLTDMVRIFDTVRVAIMSTVECRNLCYEEFDGG